MKRQIRNTLEMLIRVSDLPTKLSLPANPLADDIFTRLTAVRSELEVYAAAQVSGQKASAGGTDDRQRLAGRLRDILRPVTRTIHTLDPNQFPGITGQFRMPRSNGYQALLAAARAMLENVAPLKDALIARGLPSDFDQQIADAITALSAATDRKFRGIIVQVAGTTGLADAARRGRKLVRELDSIMRNILASQPSLLASWLTAAHIQREPKRTEEPASPSATSVENPTDESLRSFPRSRVHEGRDALPHPAGSMGCTSSIRLESGRSSSADDAHIPASDARVQWAGGLEPCGGESVHHESEVAGRVE